MEVNGLDRVNLLTALVLLCVLFAVVRSLLRKSGDDESAINLDDVILEWDARAGRDRVSIIRCLAIGAFAYSIWQMAVLTVKGQMTEAYYAAFNLAWVAPLVSQIIWGRRPPVAPPDEAPK
jgi:hypothetical protein